MNIKRAIFTTPLLLIHRFFKGNLDNFVGGLIFGAVFSLIVNIATVRVQEMIQKQRALEAIEQEMLQNVLLAQNVFATNSKKLEAKEQPSVFYSVYFYSDKVWNNSEALGYIMELDPEKQGLITTYYSVTVAGINRMGEKNQEIERKYLTDCYFFTDNLTKKAKDECQFWYDQVLGIDKSSAEFMSGHTLEILRSFHPTKDRLSSPVLKFLMGDKALGSLRLPIKDDAQPQ